MAARLYTAWELLRKKNDPISLLDMTEEFNNAVVGKPNEVKFGDTIAFWIVTRDPHGR